MKVQKIHRDNYSWGIWDNDKKEYVKVFETKAEAEAVLVEMKKAKKSS